LGFASPAEPDRGPTARARRASTVRVSERRPPTVLGFASRGFLLPRTPLRRVPLVAPPRSLDRSRVGGGCQAPTGAVLRVLAPLDGSGYARGTARTLTNPPTPWRPDASRPCFMPLASLESPFRAFPSRGAVPALAGLLLPCGFAFDQPNGAARTEGFAAPFPGAPTSRRSWPEGWLDWKAGTTVPWSR